MSMCKPEKERETEIIARKILEEILGPDVEVRRHETTCGQSQYDYDVFQGGNLIAAVEVTSATDESLKRLIAQSERCEYRIQSERLRESWLVFLAPRTPWVPGISKKPPGVSKISKELADCLAQFEKWGITQFIAELSSSEMSEIEELCGKLRRLGVKWAKSSPSEQPDVLILPVDEKGFRGSEDYVNPAVQSLAWKDDNKGKLGASNAGQRILFIYVDGMTDYPLWKQMCDFTPKEPPQLPKEITEIWMCTWLRGGSYVVWRCKPPNRWEELGPLSLDL